MKTALHSLLLMMSIMIASDTPYLDTTHTELPKPIIPFELNYYDIRDNIHRNANQRIEIEFTIDIDGNPIDPIIRDTFDVSLNDIVIDKLMETKYTPAIQNGVPVAVRYFLPIVFK